MFTRVCWGKQLLYETDISLIFTAAPLFVSGEFPNKFRRVETLDIRKWFWFLKQSSGNGNRFRKGDISAIWKQNKEWHKVFSSWHFFCQSVLNLSLENKMGQKEPENFDFYNLIQRYLYSSTTQSRKISRPTMAMKPRPIMRQTPTTTPSSRAALTVCWPEINH